MVAFLPIRSDARPCCPRRAGIAWAAAKTAQAAGRSRRGGRHVLLNWPWRPVPCSAGQIGAGIDVKGTGGYIILPPSDHASGRQYCWLIGQESGSHEIADAPAWLLEMIDEAHGPPRAGASGTAAVGDEIPEGYRNKTLASQAGHMRQIGMTTEEIAPALRAINARRCRPPLDAEEVERIAQSIGRYDPDTSRQAQTECWPERYLDSGNPTPAVGPVLTCLADVQPSKVEWLWPRRIRPASVPWKPFVSSIP